MCKIYKQYSKIFGQNFAIPVVVPKAGWMAVVSAAGCGLYCKEKADKAASFANFVEEGQYWKEEGKRSKKNLATSAKIIWQQV